jgi:hypothetical protein
MKPTRSIVVLLFAAAILAHGAVSLAVPGKGKGRARGKHAGDYALIVSGFYKGKGAVTVHNDMVSFEAVVTVDGGGSGTLKVNNLNLDKGYFKGNGKIMGVDCTVEGRVDLPDAQDDEQNDQQAITGRITGTFRDANGKLGRIVAIQQDPKPSPGNSGSAGNNANNGNPGNNGQKPAN